MEDYRSLESSIFILDKLHRKIEEFYRLTVSVKDPNLTDYENEQLFYYMMEYGMILSLSYLDELRLHFYPILKKLKSPEYVAGLKKVTGYLVTEISLSFPDLKKFRDHYLAHNMRVREVENIFVNGRLRGYRVPQNMLDYNLLINCIAIIDNIVSLEFPDAVSNFHQYQRETSINIPYLDTVHDSADKARIYLETIVEKADRLYFAFQLENR